MTGAKRLPRGGLRRLSIRLDQKDYETLSMVASRQGETMASVCCRALHAQAQQFRMETVLAVAPRHEPKTNECP